MIKKNITLLNILYLFYVLVLFFAIIGCGNGEPEKTTDSKKAPTAGRDKPSYTTKKIEVQKITDKVRAVGTVAAYQEVQISPEISGKIKKIHFSVGDNVGQGDLLLEIDDESRLISVQKRRALLKKAGAANRKASKDARKGGTLFKEGVISDSESDDIELDRQISDAELNLARAELRATEKNLRDTKIRAPYAGKVALKNVEVGKLVTPGQNLLTLVDIRKVKIFVNISELDINKISKGSEAEVMLDSLSGEVFSGIVETVGLKADDFTRTFPVEIVVLNEQEKLLPGMVARVTVKSKNPKKVVIIPKKAVRTINGMKVAYVLNGDKPEQRRLYLGADMGDQVIVEKGLAEGENLIVSEVKTTELTSR